MNIAQERSSARGFSASNEARHLMADWLRTTKASRKTLSDNKIMLLQRYPAGLFDDAELDALIGILEG